MAAAKKDDDTWRQASEISEAMLGMQPYADDSMFLLARYTTKAKREQQTLRAKDFNLFMTSIRDLMGIWGKPAEAVGGAQERSRRGAELRQTCLDIVKDYPELARDFDGFVTASRATARAFNSGHSGQG